MSLYERFDQGKVNINWTSLTTMPPYRSKSINSLDTYDSPSVRFKKLMEKTLCPFAEKADVWIASEWNVSATTSENILMKLPEFEAFAVTGKQLGKDIFVLEIMGEQCKDIFSTANVLKDVLYTLRSLDKYCNDELLNDIENLDWDFKFWNIKFFVPVFASFYPHNHPRYSQVKGSTFILFQPDFSFDKHNITSKNPKRFQISDSIHNLFTRNGSPYDLSLVRGTPKAIRYIKPTRIGEPIIKWWE